MTGLTLILSLVLGLTNGQTVPTSNYLELYTLVGQGGATTTISEYHHDLGIIGFDNLVQSVCGQGAWILYEQKNYNWSHSSWTTPFSSGGYDCYDLPVTWHGEASSVRYAGTGDLHDETITVYHSPDFAGGEIMFIREEPFLGDYNNEASSMIITGETPWTVYSHPGFHGDAICLQPHPIGDGYYFGAWNVGDIGMPNNELSSVQKGCFA
ncbi:unnamed protein product [Meganyctiphanes norvegica]|uniref:Beta/gamma crystallin 'Greek key' domain-containing protein n=1 Tax=Meganyctiphanes norvegica TaxID=48144 RepID=A0AAV2PQZ9_MEGNR